MSLETLEFIGQIGIYIFAFCFGITIGSFLNVCIYRIPKGESLIKRNSHCMTCGAEIKHRDLVPIFSWIFLRGKCRSCGAKISPRYCIVESLTGFLFLITFIKFDIIESGLIYPALLCLFLASVVVVGFEDFDTQEMSLSVLLVSAGIAVFSVIYANFLSQTAARGFAPTTSESLIGMVSVALPILIIGFVITPLIYRGFLSEDHRLRRRFKKRLASDILTDNERAKLTKLLDEVNVKITERGNVYGFGMGDVVLMAAAGLMIGVKATVAGTFFAVVLAAIFGVIKAKREQNQSDESAAPAAPISNASAESTAASETAAPETAAPETDASGSHAFAFGPFLCIGIAIGAFCGNELWDLYFGSFAAMP